MKSGTCIGAAVFLACIVSAYGEEDRGVKVVSASDSSAVYSERRVALVIGNAGYEVGRLRNPTNDADDIARILTERKFEVTLLKDANRETMENAITAFGKSLSSGGVGLFYYAGHGVQIDTVNYLIPVGEQLEDETRAKYRGIEAGLVVDTVRRAGNRLNIIILDACRDNPFHRSSRSGSRGLAQMDAPEGTIIAYATGPGQTAAEGKDRNGLYTKHLLENMVIPGQKVEEVFKTVRVAVVKDSSKKQVPWESSSLVGDFFFTPSDHYGVEMKRTKEKLEQIAKEKREYEKIQAELAEKEEAINREKAKIEQERIREEERARAKAQSDANSQPSEGGVKKVKKGASFLERMIKTIITPGDRVSSPIDAPP